MSISKKQIEERLAQERFRDVVNTYRAARPDIDPQELTLLVPSRINPIWLQKGLINQGETVIYTLGIGERTSSGLTQEQMEDMRIALNVFLEEDDGFE